MNLIGKIQSGLATLADQNEALKNSCAAYWFAIAVKGADIEKCQEVACKSSRYAFFFALCVKGVDIERCQEAACKDPKIAYWFACEIPGANLSKIKQLRPDIADKIDELIMNKALI